MPFYRFQIDSPLTTEEALHRIGGLVREPTRRSRSIVASFRRRPEPTSPFIGAIDGPAFRMRRDIRYRNSLLPRIRGCVASVPTGTRVSVSMHLHPVVAAFMLIWLGAVGAAAITALGSRGSGTPLAYIPAGMFVFGVVLMVGGFFPEAMKARRLLERSVAGAGEGPR
jgi:hypothetical protein